MLLASIPQRQQLLLLCFLEPTVTGERRVELDRKSGSDVKKKKTMNRYLLICNQSWLPSSVAFQLCPGIFSPFFSLASLNDAIKYIVLGPIESRFWKMSLCHLFRLFLRIWDHLFFCSFLQPFPRKGLVLSELLSTWPILLTRAASVSQGAKALRIKDTVFSQSALQMPVLC